jgi:predicted dehydrogenase
MGLVGCGRRGISVSRLFKAHPNCRITALMDRFPHLAEEAAGKLELADAHMYADFGKMLRDAPIDAVFLAPDPTEQVDMACEAMLAGKHACTEVPVAFTLDDCWNLVKTVEKTGAKYQPMEQVRYQGFVEVWKEMHDRGEFGHICLAQGEYVHYERNWDYWTDLDTGERVYDLEKPVDRQVEVRWRNRILGDPIFYLPHTLSPLLKILDDRVVRVSCMGVRPESYTYPELSLPWRDIEYALMHTEKDTVLLVGAGFSLPHVNRGPLACHWYELRGTKANVTSPRHVSDSFRVWRQGQDDYEEVQLSGRPLDADEQQAMSGHGGADFKPVDTFIRAILDDTVPPMDVYRAVETAAPAVLAAESARQKGVLLEVPGFRPQDRIAKEGVWT